MLICGMRGSLWRGDGLPAPGEHAPGRFDTSGVNLTEDLQDPVDLLFGTQLGGGTDINRATSREIVTSRPA